MGYWVGGLGQSLISAFNGGVGAVGVANWMALSFPNLYGINAGANNLFGKTNAQIDLLYQTKYQQAAPQALPQCGQLNRSGGEAGADRLFSLLGLY